MSHEALNDEQFEQWKSHITTQVQQHIAATRPKLDPENQARLERAQTAARQGNPNAWQEFTGEPENLAQTLGVHPSLGGHQVPTVIRQRVARHVMAQADIRQTKKIGEHAFTGSRKGQTVDVLVNAPHEALSGNVAEFRRGYPHGEVWTSQQHLHVPTLREYAQGDVPETDPDYFDKELGRSEMPYEPDTYEHGGKTWMAEGHHRTVVKRLAR
jgi:hypothetical protein